MYSKLKNLYYVEWIYRISNSHLSKSESWFVFVNQKTLDPIFLKQNNASNCVCKYAFKNWYEMFALKLSDIQYILYIFDSGLDQKFWKQLFKNRVFGTKSFFSFEFLCCEFTMYLICLISEKINIYFKAWNFGCVYGISSL